ncbi:MULTISPECIES: hypothetical protein [Mesorhizobium]|uniref:hypothetical protein n=1 Tax=Mesorhizobium TaxID=68287 RepID=UPI0010A96F66|nr:MULTISPECIES: hypothetical protein [Mesorhizobium]
MRTDASDQPRLGLIVGGVQKAGTTSLFGYLSETPQMATPSVKETHFFDDEARNWFRPDYPRLESLFSEDIGIRIGFEVTEVRMDSILEFAGIGDFIDQPAKTCSSGMLCVAFAVAAHLPTDILLIARIRSAVF